MVPRKSWILAKNFGPISKSRKSFLMRLEVSFLRLFATRNLECFADKSMCFLFFRFQKSNFSRFMGTTY